MLVSILAGAASGAAATALGLVLFGRKPNNGLDQLRSELGQVIPQLVMREDFEAELNELVRREELAPVFAEMARVEQERNALAQQAAMAQQQMLQMQQAAALNRTQAQNSVMNPAPPSGLSGFPAAQSGVGMPGFATVQNGIQPSPVEVNDALAQQLTALNARLEQIKQIPRRPGV